MDKRKFNGGGPGVGRKKGIGISFDIQKHCQRFIEDLLKDEAIRDKAVKQLQLKIEEPTEFIYIIKSNLYYKIGYTTNYKKRLKNYQTHNPDVSTICVIESPIAFNCESYLKEKFHKNNINGEWFDLNKEELGEALKYLYNICYGW